jgi:WD40 repeat protein
LVTEMRPGAAPFAAMADALLRVAIDTVPDLRERLRDPYSIGDTIERLLPADADLVLIVDQFEELFTLCPEALQRRQFMDSLCGLIGMSDGVSVIVAVRADFYGLPLQYQPFGELVRRAVVSVVPPGADELAGIIRLPAEHVGVGVSPEVVTTIVQEVAGEPGSLPLLQYALTRAFDAREGGELTIDDYRRTGGVDGALANWPEQVYGELGAKAKEAAERVFLHLVTIAEAGTEVIRRRVPFPELTELGSRAAADEVTERFGAARLLTFDRDPQTRTPTVEVAHEALLTQWSRLYAWIDEQREHLVLHQRFRSAVAEWETADRHPEFLLQGGRLRQFEGWVSESDLPLTAAEDDFLREARAVGEAAQARRRRRRRLITAALTALTLLAFVFAVVAMTQRNRAADQQRIAEEQAAVALAEQDRAETQAALALEAQSEAERQALLAQARRLALSAIATLDTDPELSILLALKAVETRRAVDGTVLREAEEALHRAVTADRSLWVGPVEMWGRSATFAPDGRVLYVGGGVTGDVFDVTSGEIGAELPYAISATELAGADDDWLAVADFSGGLWTLDRETLDEVFELRGHTDWITDLDVSADGMMLASISPYDQAVIVWDLESRSELATFELACEVIECPRNVSLSDDGQLVGFGSAIYTVVSGEEIASWSEGDAVQLVAGIGTAVVIDANTASFVDVASGNLIETMSGHRARVSTVDVDEIGSHVATGSRDGVITLWQMSGGRVERALDLMGHDGPVWKVEFSPDGRFLASIGGKQEFPADMVNTWPEHWEIRLWDIAAAGPGAWMTATVDDSGVQFTADGRSVLAVTDGAGLTRWNVESGEEEQTLEAPEGSGVVAAFALAPGGESILLGGPTTGSDRGWLAVLEPSSGEVRRELALPDARLVPHEITFSPDGSRVAVTGAVGTHVWDTTTWTIDFSDAALGFEGDDPREISGVTDEQAVLPPDQRRYSGATFSPDGSLLVVRSIPPDDYSRGPTIVWDLESGDLVSEAGAGVIPLVDRRAAAFSPDGRVLVTGGTGRPRLFEPYTGRQLGSLDAPAGNANDVAYSPGGARVATAQSDGTVRLWDATTGEERLVLPAYPSEATSVAFSPDGTRLASLSLDGTLHVWALDIDDLVTIARSRVTRAMTDDECRIWVGEGCPPTPDVERLVPALGDVAEAVGIYADAWHAAPTAGIWEPRGTEAPPADGGVVYDTESEMIVGVDTVCSWVLGPDAPSATDCAPMPPPKGDEYNEWPTIGGAVYHPGLDRVIVARTDDGAIFTYEATAGEWEEVQPGGGPFALRLDQGMVYDTGSDLVVLFGGVEWGRVEDGKWIGLADTWTYDVEQNEWTEQTPVVSPPGRHAHGTVYDAESDRVIVFGGADMLGGDVMGDTWAYDTDTNTWEEMTPEVSPPARAGHAMWYDPVGDLVFVFGGSRDWTSWPRLPWDVFGGEELWAYDYDSNSWTLMRTDPNPGYGTGVLTVYDPRNNETLLIGGDFYDDERRFRGEVLTVWAYRHSNE